MAVKVDETTGTASGDNQPNVTGRVHPEYNTWMRKWEFFLLTYFGGDEYTAGNLFKYFKEGDEEFEARKLRAYRENHSRRVIDLINSYLFKEKPNRSTENDKLMKFIDNSDGKGGNINYFMKTASQFSSALGRVYIVVDRKPLPPEETTGTQADNLKQLPYLYTIYPQDMMDIAFDDDGRVKWALVREQTREGDDDFWSAESTLSYRYRLWEKGKWTLFNASGAEIDGGDTELEFAPIVCLDHEEFSKYAGQSLIADIAFLDRAIFNNWSRLDTIVCDQTFSQLIMPIEGLLTELAENEELRKQVMTLATNRILMYSNQAGVPPAYISPDASQAEFILNMIQVQVRQLYTSIGLQAEASSEVKTQGSGVAKAYDFDKLNKLLANKADKLELAERQVFKIAKEWMGNTTAEVIVDYPDEFDTKGLVDELDEAERLVLLDISDTFLKELHKNLAAKALPKASREKMAEINKEIEQRVDDKRDAADELHKANMDKLTAPPAPPKFGGKNDGVKPPVVAGSPDGKIVNPRKAHMPLATQKQSKRKAEVA